MSTTPTSLIEALRAWVGTCPSLTGGLLNVDFLPEEAASYSVDVTPVTPVIRQYLDGSSLRQYLFTVSTRTYFGEYVRQQIDNLDFFEDLAAWFDEQNASRDWPELPAGMTAKKIEVVSSGYVFAAESETARYQMQLRLTYYQEGNR